MSEAVSVSVESGVAWRAFIETSARLHTDLDDELRRDAGLTLADYSILVQLSEADGQRLRMRDLAARMAFSSSRLSYQIDSMVKRGWLTRERVSSDRRGSYAALTPLGRSAFRKAAVGHLACVQRMFFDRIDDDDAADLLRIMTKLSAAESTSTKRESP